MNYEEAFFWWILGFGCGLLTMLGLFIWERSRQASRNEAVTADENYPWDELARSQSTYGEPDSPGPPKVVAIPKRAAKKKSVAKRAK